MDLSGLAAVTTAAEMKAWLSANCLSPISPVMTGTDLGIIIQKVIDVTDDVPSFAFENGLTNNNGTVELGGTLTGDVVYNQGNYQTKFNFTDNAQNDSFVAIGDGYVEIQTNGLTYNNSSARNVGVGTDVSISDGLMDFQVYNLTGSTYSGEFTLGVYGFANQPASSAWELMISNASGQKSFSSSLNVPFNEPSTAVNKGMIFKDSWDNMGLQYYNDYSALGKTSPRWIPDWGTVSAAISASVGGATPAWSSITGKPTTLSGYGITDAYPLTGNPSNYITLSGISNTAPITYNASTGVIGITRSTASTDGYLSSADWNTFNGKQTALSGTGFVKISGATISYDNSTYLTTSIAASTYAPKASPAFTGTVTLPNTYVNGNIIPNVNNTYNLGGGGSIFNNLWIYSINVGNAITLMGSTSGSANLFAAATTTPYNFILPSTGGAAGSVLTSSGGGSSPMTWTSLSGYLTSSTAASTYVPYTGATGAVNLGNNTLQSGNLAIGALPASGVGLLIGANTSLAGAQTTGVVNNGASAAHAFYANNIIASGQTGSVFGFRSTMSTQASTVVGSSVGFTVDGTTLGSAAAITNQYGFLVQSSLTTATNNYAFYSGIASGSGRYNLYMAGTAANFLNGNVGIGVAPGSIPLTVNGNAMFGNITNTATATPLLLSLGGTYGANTPGNIGNLKLKLYDNGTNAYGLGISANLLEVQANLAGAGMAFFVNGGTKAMNIASTGNITIGTGSGDINVINNGGNSGTAAGADFVVQNGGTSIIAIGNKSSVIGGAYDATPYLYTNAPLNTSTSLIVAGTTSTTHLIGSSGTPTITSATGAGTSPTISVVGNDLAHKVIVTTGTSPNVGSTIVSVTYAASTPVTSPYVTITPGNAAAAALSGNQQVYVDSSTVPYLYHINAGSTALIASTTYVWYVHVIQ